jgi:hypothetical protein
VATEADTAPLGPDRLVARSVGPFEWVRVDAQVEAVCSRCDSAFEASVPVFADWLDRAAVVEQRAVSDGITCPSCSALEPLDVPLMQYRRADAVGLVVGLPARSATADDEAAIRDVLALAGEASDLEGARSVAAVRMAWWPSLWNRPLGPRLAGALPLVLPESDDEAQRWRLATVDALGLPDVRSALREFLSAGGEEEALEALRRHDALSSPRWRLTVESLLGQVRAAQEDAAALAMVDERAALLARVRMLGVDVAARPPADNRASALAGRATATRDPDERLDALKELVETRGIDESDPVVIAAHLAYVEALHGDRGRRPAEDPALVEAARRTVALARGAFDDGHPMVQMAELNLAVCLEERSDVELSDALEQASAVLEELAPRAARAGSAIVADVATNMATVVARRPGSRSDNPEDAATLLEDARHVRSLTEGDRRRDVLTALVDGAATLRSKVSGSLRENAARAVALLREALEKDTEWRLLSASERVLTRSNLANALSQLHERAPADAPLEEVRRAANEAVAAARELDDENAVALDALANAGAVLIDLYSETLRAGRADATLWDDARDALERALVGARSAYPPHYPAVLRAAVNLASVYGSVRDGEVADPERCAELLEYVLSHARSHQAEYRLAAASNLAQLRIGRGDWAAATAAYTPAGEAQRALVTEARTFVTRLGEVVKSADIAARRALVLVLERRFGEAVDVLEENRVRLARVERQEAAALAPAADPRSGRAIVHVATCDYGTLGVVELPSGIVDGFSTTLASSQLKPLVRELLEAPDRESRRQRLDDLVSVLGAGVVQPLVAHLQEADEPVGELVLVACGTLASCPLHCVPAVDGQPLLRSFAVREVVSASGLAAMRSPSPDRAIAVVDPDGTLPFARAEREALSRWATSVSEPPPGTSAHGWLLGSLPEATAVHLACHGRLDPEDPMRSRFDVAKGSPLTVADLTRLSTPRLDLVVAPACQSASASPDAPDELLGVAHVLAHAGARVVIASLWDADDASTALVVARFYEELRGGVPPAVALRRAQDWVAVIVASDLAELAAARLGDDGEAAWLPYDLAIELSALAIHPKLRSSAAPPFGHPADWASLSCLEA